MWNICKLKQYTSNNQFLQRSTADNQTFKIILWKFNFQVSKK